MAEAAAIETTAAPVATPAPSPAPSPSPVATPAATPNPLNTETGTPTPAPSTWADDWRDQLAEGDEKYRKRLDRFASPKELSKSYRALEQRISSGELKAAKLADDATDEQKADWRKENGIPEKATDYIADLPEGLVIGEHEKATVNTFLEQMHKAGAPKGFVQEALKWNQVQQEQQLEAIHTLNHEGQQATEDALRTEYGQEYRPNINQVKAMFAGAPEGVADLVTNARTPDGLGILNNPGVMRWFVQMAKELNPVSTLTGGSNSPSGIEDELSQISKVRRENYEAYFKDTKMQERERQLLAAQERHK